MTDNFKRYREYIELCGGLPDDNEHGNLDKYYCIELKRRGKDNPDLPAANYHFRNYYIYSWRDLENLKLKDFQNSIQVYIKGFTTESCKRISLSPLWF